MSTHALKRLFMIAFVGVIGTFLQPARAATTSENPRYDVCWGYYSAVGNSAPEIYGGRNMPGSCYKTLDEFYDVFVETINKHYPKPGDPDAVLWRDYGWVDYGPGYGATWVKTATFRKMSYNGAPCTEPPKPWSQGTTRYCGVERTDTTVFSCAVSSCAEWISQPGNAVQVTVVRDSDVNAIITGFCVDTRLKKVTNAKGGQDPAGCANIIDRYFAFEECKSCAGRLKGGNPIYPMTGAKKEVVPTGLSVGGQAMTLTYNTLRELSARADGLTSAAQLNDLPSFGPLWSSSLHRRLNVKVGNVGIDAYRGDGSIVGFGLNAPGGSYVASAGSNDTLTVISGGYRYFDAAAAVVETYNSAGRLISAADKNGNTLTFSYSAEPGAVAPAAGYLVSVTDNAGRSISFSYLLPAGGVATSDGLVSTISASDGSVIAATYDAANNLTALTWQDGKSRSFQYEIAALPWALTGKTDENGVRQASWAYDAEGRAISSDGALGTNHYGVTYGTPPRMAITETLVVGNGLNYPDTIYRDHIWQAPGDLQLTDASGTTANAMVATPNGYPVLSGISQAAGSGCSASNSAATFDARGNLLSHEDFKGVRTCYAYDAKDQEVTRVEGLSTSVDCATVLPTTATLPVGARKYKTTWDPNWRTPVMQSQPGSVTTLVYQGQPDPQNANAPANCSPAAALANGAPLNLLCKSIVQLAGGANFDNPAAASADPLIDKVVLLLHGEDGNGSPVFADSSAYMKNPTSYARNPIVTTTQKKFGASSINLDNTTGSVGFGAIGYGPDDTLKLTGDFTIEMFVKLNVQSDPSRKIFGWGGNPSDGNAYGEVFVDSSGRLTAYWQESYWANNRTITGPVISTGVWHHIALSRSSGNWIMHLDGVQAGSAVYHNNSDAFAYGRFELGRHVYAMGYGTLNGYLDEVRITKGAVRYWANFTPPSQAFADPVNLDPSVPKQVDPYYAQDTLLLHADGADGSKTIVDSSPTAAPGTLKRNVQIRTTEAKFGGSSFYVPGSTDYGDYGIISGDFSLPGDFTVELWMKPSSTSAGFHALRIGGGSIYDDFIVSGDRLVLQRSDGSYCMFGTALAGLANTWIHVAFVRISGTIVTYVNGNSNGSCTRTTTVGGTSYVVFGYNSTSNAVYYDDIRITKGRARYTAAFIPSAYAAPNVATLPPNSSINTTQYTYDAAGRVLTVKDTLNRTTSYAYFPDTQFTGTAPAEVGHTAGDLQSITNPAGHVTQFTQYDRAGRVRQMIDPKGLVTDISYTPRGWVSTVTTTAPGGAGRTTGYSYDGVGQLTGVTQPDGTSLSYSYDAAHRLIGVTDAKGNAVNYTLDNVGNRIGEDIKDPTGTLQRSISRSFDALNRLQQVTGAAR